MIKIERSWQCVSCENHSGKIRLLQKFDQPTRERLVVPDGIEKDAPAVASEHDVSKLWLVDEFSLRGEAGVVQNFW